MSRPYHIYMDLEVRNDDVHSMSSPPPLSFEETRLQPFLDGDASDYFCTIARFTLQTGNSLPVLIPAINTNQTVPAGQTPNIDETIYTISFLEQPDPIISASPSTRLLLTKNLKYEPCDKTIPKPRPPNGEQDLSSEYYHMRSYTDFINMINITLRDLYIQLPNVLTRGNNPPYMEWDAATCTATLYADSYYFDLTPNNPLTGAGRTRKFEIYFNARLYQLFSTLNATLVNATSDLDYRLDIFGNATNTTKLSYNDASGNALYNISLAQEVSTIGVWSPVESIVFTTTSLPINPSMSSSPKVLTNGDSSTTGSGQPNIANILTDFQIAVSPTNQYRPEISYAPQAEYRLIDMLSNNSLSRIDLQVYWKDKRGELHRVLLYPGCSASVKLLFRHKHFYLGIE
jgi:hypothetical protein